MRLLLVEDEIELASLIRRVLMRERYDIDVVHDGEEGLDLALSGAYDGIILDRMLPRIDGLAICGQLRNHRIDTPVLILSALRDLGERVEGLDVGADDYLGKPFAFEELTARVRALTRRNARPLLPSVLSAANIELHTERREVRVDNKVVDLTPTEFTMLEYLMRNAGQAMSRDQILEQVWGYDADPEGNVVDLYIHYLRRKLKNGRRKAPIETVRGVGYTIRAG
ncbi:response regulator transcription factor [soil metagenome]